VKRGTICCKIQHNKEAHMDTIRFSHIIAVGLVLAGQAALAACPAGVDPKSSTPISAVSSTSNCKLKTSHGYPLPDAACTPGAINPTVDTAVLKGGKFKTACDRDVATSAEEKATTYAGYTINKPTGNTGKTQSCELDHLVSLELGGADTLDNIWPQCGPPGVLLAKRYFKIKDAVENYLAASVKAGDISLKDAQQGIAVDWTQYIAQSNAYWRTHKMTGFGSDQ
jgi:hypothetical protein